MTTTPSTLQPFAIDITAWEMDEIHGNYPEGARSKRALFPPITYDLEFIEQGRRYLAKLPGDGFELYADLTHAKPPFELVIEVAGFRHQSAVTVDDIFIGDVVTLKPEPDNAHDPNAIAIHHVGNKIGFIDRAQAPSFKAFLRKGYRVSATIERINGKIERPLVYLFIVVR